MTKKKRPAKPLPPAAFETAFLLAALHAHTVALRKRRELGCEIPRA